MILPSIQTNVFMYALIPQFLNHTCLVIILYLPDQIIVITILWLSAQDAGKPST